MNQYFMSDPHWDHSKILGYSNRPFATIEEHDEYVIDRINHRVQRNDILWLLGDLGRFPKLGKYRARIKCRQIHLIWGNHDTAQYAQHFSSAKDTRVVKVLGERIFLSHYAHAFWPGSHRGWGHLYGHTHDMREEFLDAILPGRRSTDVGIDTAKRLLGDYMPFRDTEIIDLLFSRPGHDNVEFYREFEKTRKMYQLDADNRVIEAPPSLELRPATPAQVKMWMRNR